MNDDEVDDRLLLTEKTSMKAQFMNSIYCVELVIVCVGHE